jgi:hypothetical protein
MEQFKSVGYVAVRRLASAAFTYATLFLSAPAVGVDWGSCALGANCSAPDCYWNDHGYPGDFGDVPVCYTDEEAPPCYFCTYTQPSPTRHGYCTLNPEPFLQETGPVCSDCRMGSWPGSWPECPNDIE